MLTKIIKKRILTSQVMKYIRLGMTIVVVLLSMFEGRAEYRYRLTLDGKPESQPVPLSARAEERRERLGIELDSADLEISPLYLSQLTEAGLTLITQSRWLNTVVVMKSDGSKVEDWSDFPFVTRVEMLTTVQRATAPWREEIVEDPVKPVIGNCRAPLVQVNAMKSLYEAGFRGKDMLIAVLDAGFTHVDTWDWLMDRVVGYRDLYAKTTGKDHTFDGDTHGTCCLSIMVSPQSHGVWGTAQEAEYYLIRTETDDSETQLEEDMWVAGAELADSIGADIISSSLGYYSFDYGEDHKATQLGCNETFVSQGAKIACRKGLLVCNAAGNEGNKPWKRLIFPSDTEEVLTVGGVTSANMAASFTSRGFLHPYVKPDISALAVNCYTVDAYDPQGGACHTGAGTSYATPLIAGLCASLWSAVPVLHPEQLRQVVRESASQFATPDSIIGYGIPDFDLALRLARELVGEEQGIETINADVPGGDIDTYYNIWGQPISESQKGGFRISRYLRRKSFRNCSFQHR